MKYCVRKVGSYPAINGSVGDTVWELDDEMNFVRAYAGYHPRRQGGFMEYELFTRDPEGRRYKVKEISEYDCGVRIRDVRGLMDTQIKAIKQDLADGSITNLY